MKLDCPCAKECGSCFYTDCTYTESLKKKQKKAEKLFGGSCHVYPITGMEEPFHYRNKVHATFKKLKDGTIISGPFQEGSHRIVNTERCVIENETAGRIIRTIRELAVSFRIPIYNETTHRGLLRRVLIRTGTASGQVLVVLVTGNMPFGGRKSFVEELKKRHPEITTIVQSTNQGRTSMILGETERILYGKGTIEDVLCGCVFQISAASFYQINSVQTEKLYRKAMELASLTGVETVVDAYCGIGTIGLIAAGQAKEIIGIELNKRAVRDAVSNAKRNQIRNVHFIHADAGICMQKMAEEGRKAQVLFLDPPRSGSTKQFLHSAARMDPERIVYISCNPETLKRDMVYLEGYGYRPREAWPFDMFCWCDDIETVMLFERKSGKE